MRSIRNLVLLAMMAITATMAMAPSAFAQSETEPLAVAPHDLEARSEPSGALCPGVLPATPPVSGEFTTSGGCFVHGGGTNIALLGHFFGIEATDSVCDIESDLRFSNAGGYITHQEMTGGEACTRRPCHYPNTPNPDFEPPSTRNGNHNEARPWRTYAEEDPGPATTEVLRVLFCLEARHDDVLEPAGNRRHCNIVVPFTETPANHRYTFDADPDVPGSGSPRCEIRGIFTMEGTQMQGPGTTESTRTPVEVNHI